MRILFLTSAHNSFSQRLLIELTERGHDVSVVLATSEDGMLDSVAERRPELIIAPMLKIKIPEAIWSKYTCLIVHPGIKGDRGPSSLDWAIATGEKTWGVTILQAAADWDGSSAAKSSLYRHEVTEAAVRGVLEAVAKFESRQFQPEPLDCSDPAVLGCFSPAMRQCDRAINWERDSADSIGRKINAADSAPGVLDRWFGKQFYHYGAHHEDQLKGQPGQFLALREGAICRAVTDGAVWITHLKAKDEGNGAGIKLPAASALAGC